MSAVLVGHLEPGSPEWHAARAHGLGGSEIPAVLGLSPYESRFSLWHRKAGNVGPVEENDEMHWGRILEPVITAEFENRHPEWYVINTGTWQHAERPWQVGNPDSLLYRDFASGAEQPNSLLETKLSMYGDGWGETGTDQVPPHVRCQVIWYGDILGLNRAHVCVFIASGLDIRTYQLAWDETEAEMLRAAATEFLDSLTTQRQPDIDAHSATYAAVKELHPDIDGTTIDLDPATAQTYIAAKVAEKAAKAAAQHATSILADQMGTAHKAVCDGVTIATRQARGDGYPYPVIARGLTDNPPALTAPAADGADRFDLRPGETRF